MMAHKSIWSEGLLISQHHLQQQDRYHEALLHEHVQEIAHFNWGVTDVEIDDRSLAAGQVKLKRFAAIWPDGESIRCGEGTDEPVPAPGRRTAAGHDAAVLS